MPPLTLSGTRGEIVSGQAVFFPGSPINAATVSISNLTHTRSGKTIPASAVKLQWVRYIDVARNTEGIPDDELVAKAPSSIPDPFWENTTIPVNNQAQPVWIEIKVPRNAEKGEYTGVLTVSGSTESAELSVKLNVWNFKIPEERHLSMINWWTFPGMGFDVEEFSEEYWDLLASFADFVHAHRQTDVWAFFNLIKEEGDSLKGYSYDTSLLERYVETVFNSGIRQIHMHVLGTKTAHILDPTSRIAPIEENFRRLPALQALIKRKGWEGRFIAAISDEPFIHHEKSFAELVDRVHKDAPGIRIVEALEAEYLGKLDIYVPKLSHLNMWYPRFDQVRKQGLELWFYTCCHPVGRYPNRFLDQSLLKVRVLHWINYLYDLTGYLHWGLNMQWDGDGDAYTQEAISKDLPLGDRAVAYPGKNGLLGSLRFSAQRDGLQDYEYLWTLENKLRQIKTETGEDAFWLNPRQRPLELCRRVIWSFHDYTRNPDILLNTRRTIAEEIEALEEGPLLIVQTSPPEGTFVPEGPRFISIRGLAQPGAEVTVNGKPADNITSAGYFYQYHFFRDGNPTIEVETEYEGRTRRAARTFKLEE